MQDYPAFMKNPVNAIAAHQKSPGVEGYVFDGADGSQMAVFQCSQSGISKEHVHDFDEYFVVIQGEYVLGIKGDKITMIAGHEYLIPRGVPHDGVYKAGTRTIHAFGGRRAERAATASR
ncbi:MAG TPA: cupin domain-containing protein [Nitrospirota bacterium]|nr:cupin domain-containing protein [Nitrospirota bacterium]